MLSKSYLTKPLLGLCMLVLASIACYSDHPLWPYELTATPPPATPLPTPSNDNPAKYSPTQFTTAPQPETISSKFLLLPDDPRESGTFDRKQCEYNRTMEVLYVGRENIIAIPDTIQQVAQQILQSVGVGQPTQSAADSYAGWLTYTNETYQFAFLYPGNWTLVEGNNYVRLREANVVLDINFVGLGESTDLITYTNIPDGDIIRNGVTTSFLNVPLENFVLAYEGNIKAVYFNAGRVFETTQGQFTITLRELRRDQSWYLVDCVGVVGWVNENALGGPLPLLIRDIALTTEIGATQAGFPIEPSEPPNPPTAPPLQPKCKVGDIVRVDNLKLVRSRPRPPIGLFNQLVSVYGNINASSEQENVMSRDVEQIADELWYNITCVKADGTGSANGWVLAERLFGPLRFARSNDVGIVLPNRVDRVVAEAPITADAVPAAEDGSNVIGRCSGEGVITRLGGERRIGNTVYTQINCNGLEGWTNTVNLYGEYRDIIALTQNPAPADAANPVNGTCITTTALQILNSQTVGDQTYYEVSCGNVQGWAAADDVVITLTKEAGSDTTDGAICPVSNIIITKDVKPLDDKIYYLVSCGIGPDAQEGWSVQDQLVKVPLPHVSTSTGTNTTTLLYAPYVRPAAPDDILANFEANSFSETNQMTQLYEQSGLPNEDVGECPYRGQVQLLEAEVVEVQVGERDNPILERRLFYRVTCLPTNATGWVDESTLLPLVFLTDVPGRVGIGNTQVVGECHTRHIVELLNIAYTGNNEIFYEVRCLEPGSNFGAQGWVNEDRLLQGPDGGFSLAFTIGETVAITDSKKAAEQSNSEDAYVADGFYLEGAIQILFGNKSASIVGKCVKGTPARILAVDLQYIELGSTGSRAAVLYQIECQEEVVQEDSSTGEEPTGPRTIIGWVSQGRLRGPVLYNLNQTAQLTETGLLGEEAARAFYLHKEPQAITAEMIAEYLSDATTAPLAGACALNSQVTLETLNAASKSEIRTPIYYRVTCPSAADSSVQITGWVDQARLTVITE